jgi:choline-sulfatase
MQPTPSRNARRTPSEIALGLVSALAGASIVSALVSIPDAWWARAAVTDSAPPSMLALAAADVGLVAPASLGVGFAVAVFFLAVEGGRVRTLGDLWTLAWPGDPTRRAGMAALYASAPTAIVLWLAATANVAKRAMSVSGGPRASGFVMALCAVAIAAVAGGVVLATRRLLAATAGRWPIRVACAGLALGVLLFAWGIASGNTSGEPGGLAVLGVLKRPELDLRAPGLLALVAAAAFAAPRVRVRRSVLLLLTAIVLPLVLTVVTGRTLGAEPSVAAAIERGAPLGRIALAGLRRATDADHDGASAYFGGGDCNDRDPNVGPSAIDVPGNGVDEDCSGADAPVVARAAAPAAVEARAAKGLNVLLITIDALRADLGFAGYPKPVTPTLDALAARSTVFERAYALASYTGKAIGPMMTGKYPSETHRGWGHFNNFGREDIMVAERLQKAGVRTLGAQAHWYFTRCGLARGFDVWDTRAQPPPGTDQDNDATVTGGKLTDAMLDVLGNPDNTKTRFFAWMHYLDPHSEYARHPDAPDFGKGAGRAAYDREVWYVDHHIARILKLVDEQPWGKNTAIIVSSDHGEAFGEHGMIRHGFEIWEPLVRVPLVIYVPGAPPRRVGPRRGLVDLVPTILALFAVDPPPGDGTDFVSGRSLLGDVLGPTDREPETRDVFIDMPAGPHNGERRALIHGDEKLVVADGVRFQLFDLASDPDEAKDQRGDAARLAAARTRYDAFKASLREVRVKPVAAKDE